MHRGLLPDAPADGQRRRAEQEPQAVEREGRDESLERLGGHRHDRPAVAHRPEGLPHALQPRLRRRRQQRRGRPPPHGRRRRTKKELLRK